MIVWAVLLVSVLSLVFAAIQAVKVIKKSPGNEKMKEISDLIHKGAMTFLNKEYLILAGFILVVATSLYYFIGRNITIAFILGAVFSASVGNIGMRIATKSNARAAEGAKKSVGEGLLVAFSSGTVM